MALSVLRLDPTRSASLRRAVGVEIGKWFNELKKDVWKSVVTEDDYGLAEVRPNPVNAVFNSEHKYASTQVDVHDLKLINWINQVNAEIPENDIVEREDKPHITVRYGLHDSPGLASQVKKLTTKFGPISVWVGPLSLFRSPEFDVLKYEIESDDLHRLNGLLRELPHTDTHPTYHPHMTVAYVKPSTGDKYLSLPGIPLGTQIVFDEVTFSDVKRNKYEFALNAGRFKFASSDIKVKKFTEYIGERYDTKVNSKTQEAVLTRYIVTMHDKGLARSYSDATGKERALRGANKQAELMSKAGRAEFLKRAKVDPSLIDRVKVLASRTYMDIQGATKQSADKMRRILVDGMATGTNPKEVGRKLMKELDLTKNQAMRIARTEMIRAHAEGQLDAFERLGMKGVMAEVEFSATKRLDGTFDTRVCPACQELDGTLYSLEYPLPRGKKSPRGIIPVHPHCRCAWKPAKDEEPEEEVKPKSRPKPKGKKPAPRPTPKKVDTYDDSEIEKVLKTFKVEMFGKTISPSKPGKTKLIPRKRPKPKAKVRPKVKYLKTSPKTKPKRVVKKKPVKKVTRNTEYDPDLLAFSRFVVNAFCPTGPGGGIDNSCSPVSQGFTTPAFHGSKLVNFDMKYHMAGRGGYRYWTDSKEHAKGYAGEKGTLIEGHLKIEKPLDLMNDSGPEDISAEKAESILKSKGVDTEGIEFRSSAPMWRQVQADGLKYRLRDAGYDAIIISEKGEDKSYFIMEDAQIFRPKSGGK